MRLRQGLIWAGSQIGKLLVPHGYGARLTGQNGTVAISSDDIMQLSMHKDTAVERQTERSNRTEWMVDRGQCSCAIIIFFKNGYVANRTKCIYTDFCKR